METEKELNAKILEITMTIMEKYPELSNYLGEMPLTIPDKAHPKINSTNLKAYYNSLSSILEDYIFEHKQNENQKSV